MSNDPPGPPPAPKPGAAPSNAAPPKPASAPAAPGLPVRTGAIGPTTFGSVNSAPPPAPSIPPRAPAPATPGSSPLRPSGVPATAPPAPPARPVVAGAVNSGSLIALPSTQAKIDLAATALKLRDEQILAKVTFFGADQETNKELDAITDAVIAELQTLQHLGASKAASRDSQDVEIELTASMRGLLEKLLSPRREQFLKRKLDDIQRRISSLFFESELYARLATNSVVTRNVASDDEALYHALRANRETLVGTLRSMSYASPDVLEDAISRLEQLEKGFKMSFLSRTTPELERLLAIYRAVLEEFFTKHFKADVGDFAWDVIRESGVGKGHDLGYKLGPDAFPRFREVFDKKFIERLVLNVQEPIVEQVLEMRDSFRDDTLRFVAAPQIFSEICSVMCDALYDFFYSEGFLDLPVRWREHLARI